MIISLQFTTPYNLHVRSSFCLHQNLHVHEKSEVELVVLVTQVHVASLYQVSHHTEVTQGSGIMKGLWCCAAIHVRWGLAVTMVAV